MADVNSSGVGNPRSVPHWLEEVTREALGGRIEVICCLTNTVEPELVLEEACDSIGWSQEQVFSYIGICVPRSRFLAGS